MKTESEITNITCIVAPTGSDQALDEAEQLIWTLLDDDLPEEGILKLASLTKLARIGIPAKEEHVFTCAMATARYLAQHKPGGTVYVIGEGGLLNALHENGYSVVDHSPDYVVVGEGRTLTLEMLETAVQMILDGAKQIATNLDPNCPTKNGTRPGCGATVAYLETATGSSALSLGNQAPS